MAVINGLETVCSLLDLSYEKFQNEYDMSVAKVSGNIERLHHELADLHKRFGWSLNSIIGFDSLTENPGKRSDIMPELIRVGMLNHKSGLISLPALLPLLNSQALLYDSQDDKESGDRWLQEMCLRTLTSVKAMMVKVKFIDLAGYGECFGQLLSIDKKIIGEVLTNQTEVDAYITSISSTIKVRQSDIVRNGCKTIEEYNGKSSEKMIYECIFINMFPLRLSDNQINNLLRIIKYGASVGIIMFLTLDKNTKMPDNIDADYKNYFILLQKNNINRISKLWDDSYDFLMDQMNGADYSNLITKINTSFMQLSQQQTDMLSFMAPSPSQTAVNQLMCAPFGLKVNSKDIVEYCIGSTRSDGIKHSLILGRSGSGKSILLHNIIINFAWNYHPKDLRFYFMDFKNGNEFQYYAKLPHTRVVQLDNNKAYGVSVLSHITDIIKERSVLFTKKGCQNVDSYRKTGEHVPTIIVVIDEFQQLLNSYGNDSTIEFIAQQGRSYGIFLILATQSLAGVQLSTNTQNNISTRILMQSNSDSDARTVLGDNSKHKNLLQSPGECLFCVDVNMDSFIHMRSGAIADGEIEAIVEKLKNTYPKWCHQIVYSGNAYATWESNYTILSEKAKLYLGEATLFDTEHANITLSEQLRNMLILGSDMKTVQNLVHTLVFQIINKLASVKVFIVDGFDDQIFQNEITGHDINGLLSVSGDLNRQISDFMDYVGSGNNAFMFILNSAALNLQDSGILHVIEYGNLFIHFNQSAEYQAQNIRICKKTDMHSAASAGNVNVGVNTPDWLNNRRPSHSDLPKQESFTYSKLSDINEVFFPYRFFITGHGFRGISAVTSENLTFFVNMEKGETFSEVLNAIIFNKEAPCKTIKIYHNAVGLTLS